MLESGEFATITELAEREAIVPSNITRGLRLTLPAPGMVKAILDGRQGPEVTLARARPLLRLAASPAKAILST